MDPLKLPDDFLFGVTTSSFQIEGGNNNSSWYRWIESSKIKNNLNCLITCDHWNRFDEDIDLIKKINSQTYKMSIEWGRIEPKKNVFNKESIEHYRTEILKLKKAGIQPLITLHHFSNPLWFEDQKSWLNEESIKLFERYTEYVVRNLGDLVPDWITINEPNIYLYNGFLAGIWPPGVKKILSYFKASKNIILAHIKAYKKIHEVRLNMNLENTKVGIANRINIFEPKNNNIPDKFICKIYDLLFHKIFYDGMTEGKLLFPVGNGYPYGKGKYFDFLGINYHSKKIVSFVFNIKSFFSKTGIYPDSETADLDREINQDGLYRICKSYYDKYKIPIFIMENGISDTNDEKRIKFIYDNLFQIKKLIDEGVDIKRYYHKTLMDDFEWLEGFSTKYGFFSVDYDTQKRKIKKSGEFYSELSKNKEINEKMINKFINKKRTFDLLISEYD